MRLSIWGAVGGVTLAASITAWTTTARAPRLPILHVVARTPFERVVTEANTVSVASSVPWADVVVSNGRAAVVGDNASSIGLFDTRTGKRLGILLADSVETSRPRVTIAAVDSGRWVVLDRHHSTLEQRNSAGTLVWKTALPRGVWGMVAWDAASAHAIVTGWMLRGKNRVAESKSVHEFDNHGVEIASYREPVATTHPWQASFNTPFAAVAGAEVVSATSLTNEIQIVDRSSGRERTIRVADDWFRPLHWGLERPVVNPTTVAEPILTWLRSQTMLTAVMPLSGGRLLARFTQHSPAGESYVYALTNASGRTICLTSPTEIKLTQAIGDTVYGIRAIARNQIGLFVGLMASTTGF